jgi:hypothetical protein
MARLGALAVALLTLVACARERPHAVADPIGDASVASAPSSAVLAPSVAVASAPSASSTVAPRVRPKASAGDAGLGPAHALNPHAWARFPAALPAPRPTDNESKTVRMEGTGDPTGEYFLGWSDFHEHGVSLFVPRTMLRSMQTGMLRGGGTLEEVDEFEIDGAPAMAFTMRRPDAEGTVLHWRVSARMDGFEMAWVAVRSKREETRWSPIAESFLASLRVAGPAGAASASAAR